MISGLHFHHLGLAVRQPQPAETFVRSLGYRLGSAVFDPQQNVHCALWMHDTAPAIEILWPGETKGPLDGMVQRHPAGIVYHVCYETTDLPAVLAGFEAAGVKVICISPPKIAPLFEGRTVSFYNVTGMGLIEIIA